MEEPKLYILVVLEIPEPVEKCVSVAWTNFLETMKNKTMLPGLPLYNPSTHGEQLAKNSWLLNVPDGLPFLARLIGVAHFPNNKIPYSIRSLCATVQPWPAPHTESTQKPN
jgi:hypothetical protein